MGWLWHGLGHMSFNWTDPLTHSHTHFSPALTQFSNDHHKPESHVSVEIWELIRDMHCWLCLYPTFSHLSSPPPNSDTSPVQTSWTWPRSLFTSAALEVNLRESVASPEELPKASPQALSPVTKPAAISLNQELQIESLPTRVCSKTGWDIISQDLHQKQQKHMALQKHSLLLTA